VNRSLPQDYTRPCIENNLARCRWRCQTDADRHEYELFLTPAEHAWADQFIADHNLAQRRRIGFHVGSGGTKKFGAPPLAVGELCALIQS